MFIPDLVALNSETTPSAPFWVYATPDSCKLVHIMHLEFGRATQRAAHLLRPDPEGSDRQVVALLALSDTILFHALMAGLITANLIPFPISPRNSPAGILHLLRASSCHRIIATCVTLAPLLDALQKHIAESDPQFELKIEEVPSLQQIYPNLGAEMPDSPFHPHWKQNSHPSVDDICMYIHSSGSTGLPRAIAQTHRAVMQWSALPAIAETRVHTAQPIGNMALPSFHLFGIICQFMLPLSGTCVAVYPPTATSPNSLPMIPSPDNFLDHARRTGCRALTTVPAFLAPWLASAPAIAYLKTMHSILWSGGPLPQRIGDALTEAGLHLLCGYGSTETGPISTVIQYDGDAKEWAWFRVADVVKVRWAPQGDGTFECQVLAWEKHTPIIENLDDVKGYATSDLCINHPQKKHLWKCVGRIDDTIIHSSGEKTVPGPMEDIITSSPYITGAVMFGRARPQTGILIETTPSLQIDVQDVDQLAALRNKIWPIIADANEIAPAFSRIFKEMILFSSRDKPLPRAAKGTVMRKAAIALYAEEIEATYNTVDEQVSVIDSIDPPVEWDAVRIQEWLLALAVTLCNSTAMSPTRDLFQQGFDSLTATIFRLRIMRALRSQDDPVVARAADAVPQNLVYAHPTIAELADHLSALVAGRPTETEEGGVQIENLIAKYGSGLASTGTQKPHATEAVVVLLTGSTGSLGSQILASLLKDDRVSKIYAFNRPSASRTLVERHLDIFNERGLDPLLLASPKLVFVEGQANQDNLGLTSALYEEIRNLVTMIIHNAWTVDFNSVLSSFEPHIRGTRHLLDLALSSVHTVRFLFNSSIAAAQLWDSTRDPCPEEFLRDGGVAMGGYGQSKYVAEGIVAKSAVNATCLRIGQVCGALPKGAWATSDWVPILVKTSITLGCLPLADGLVSWIDFETVAQALIDVSFNDLPESEPLPTVLNLVHPRPVAWNYIVRCIRDVLLKGIDGGKDLKLVEFSDWCQELRACEARGGYGRESLPGLKLLQFFQHLSSSSLGSTDGEVGGISFLMDKMQARSPAVREANSITEENVRAWVDYWHTSGFI
ncbi:putative aminoadipate reductase [Mycena maculata]|uniref:Aminoadipate reductase n=1 Tax=Mycena maculata TaxID=230809 RepID=A0AAD7NVA9_9AGAR|nr:putative aminoadipate reductase [Mycena maculata]